MMARKNHNRQTEQTGHTGNTGQTGRSAPGRDREQDESLIPKHGGYARTRTWALADLIYDVTVRFCDKYVDRRSRTHDQMVQAARSGVQNLQEGSVDSAVSRKIEIKLTGIARGSLMELQRDYQKFLKHRSLAEWAPGHPALRRFRALRCSSLEQFRQWVAEETGHAKAEERLKATGEVTRADTGDGRGAPEQRPEQAQEGTRTGADGHGQTRGPGPEQRQARAPAQGPEEMGEGTGTDTGQHGPTRQQAGAEPGACRSVSGPCASVAGPCASVPGPCASVSPPASAATSFPAVCAANGVLSLLNLCVYLIGRQMDAQAATFEEEGGFTERLYRIRQARRKRP